MTLIQLLLLLVVGKGGVCVTHSAKVSARKRCSFKGCTNHVQRRGVCVTHGAKVKRCSFKGCTSNARTLLQTWLEKFQRNNNPTLQPNADFTPINDPPHQSTNYENEEELNSLIWRSDAHMTGHGA